VVTLSGLCIEEGDFGFVDVAEKKMYGDRKLVCELTIKDGKVVWDLNGISSELYH